jgi:hypothetical protein
MTESQQVRGRHTGPGGSPESQPQDRTDGRAEVVGRNQDGDQAAGEAQGQVQGNAGGGRQEQVVPHHAAHGQSLASWTCVSVIMVGALVMAVAVVITTVWLFVVGAVIVVLGVISGKVLSAMGFGVSGRPGQ